MSNVVSATIDPRANDLSDYCWGETPRFDAADKLDALVETFDKGLWAHEQALLQRGALVMRDEIVEDIRIGAHICGPRNGVLFLELSLQDGNVSVSIDIERILIDGCEDWSDDGEHKPEWSKRLVVSHLRKIADNIEGNPSA